MTADATKARSTAERESMLASVEGAVTKYVRNAQGIPAREYDDVMQEARLALWEASARFDPGRGTKWSTYAIAAIRHTLANWTARHNHEQFGAVRNVDNEYLSEVVAAREDEPDPDPADDLDGDTMGRLAAAVRRGLSEGVLAKLRPGHRRLVERVAFEGLSVHQIAEQDGHPVKAVRTNLKAAVRKLVELGLAEGVATDAEVRAVTAAPTKVSEEQKQAQAARNSRRAALDADLRKALAQELADERARAALDPFGPDVRAAVLDLAVGLLTVPQLGTRLGLWGANTRALVQQVLDAVRAHNAALPRPQEPPEMAPVGAERVPAGSGADLAA